MSAVLHLLETAGYDGVRQRAVAEHSHVSLRTIYKYFPTQDELIVAALERWMAEHAYLHLEQAPTGLSLYDGLMWMLQQVFEPWEQHPELLTAFHRATLGPGAERLKAQGFAAVVPASRFFERLEPEYAADVALILGLAVRAVLERCSVGDLTTTEIVPALERVVFRLTADNASSASAAVVDMDPANG